MDVFHKLDRLDRNLANHWEWIEYLNAEREILMSNIEDLKAKLPALDEAVRQVGDYVHTLSQKVDEASAPHPAVQEMIDHVTGLTDALARMVPQDQPQTAPEAAPEPALSHETPADADTQ